MVFEWAERQTDCMMPRIFRTVLAATSAGALSMDVWTVPRIEETADGLGLPQKQSKHQSIAFEDH